MELVISQNPDRQFDKEKMYDFLSDKNFTPTGWLDYSYDQLLAASEL